MNTISTEDYIKNIFELQSHHGFATTNALADILKISPPSVTDMLQKLAKQKVLIYTPYKGATLTRKGDKIALKIIRKHRLWEIFLVEVLKFNWDEIHEEAENFEHIMTDQMEEKIDKFLNFPKFDPHGSPIPNKNGVMPKIKLIKLSDASVGDELVIKRVSDEEKDLLKFVSKINLKINKKISVIDKLSFDNSLVLKVDRRKQIISSKLAENIFVEELL